MTKRIFLFPFNFASRTGRAGRELCAAASRRRSRWFRKGQEWRELFDKYNKPVYDELLANGTISAYWVEVEQVHTDNPNWRYVGYVAPTDALNKVGAAFQAAGQKRGPDANQAVGRGFADVSVAGAHRDHFARVISYGQK